MRIMVFAAFICAAFAAHAGETWQKLVSPAALSSMSGVLILDIRTENAYRRGHIEGAVSAPYGWWRGPRENPGQALTDAALTDVLRRVGAAPDRPTVVTFQGKNATDFGAAARVYWTLKSAGLTQIAILNGGLSAWQAAGLPLSAETVAVAPSTITATLSDRWMLDRAGVQDVLDGKSQARLVDARPLGYFTGKTAHPAAAKAGTLKGALRVLHSSWFGEQGAAMVSTPEAAAEIAARAGYDGVLEPGETLVSFCNTGHWAATNWFALSEVAGIEGVKLYPESMVGWTRAGGKVVRGEGG